MGGRFRPGEPFDVAADLDDVLAEQLNDERGNPRFVRVQQPAEPSLADEAIVMPGVDARGHELFQVAQPGDKARGRLRVVDPVRNHHGLTGNEKTGPGMRKALRHRPGWCPGSHGKRRCDVSDDRGQPSREGPGQALTHPSMVMRSTLTTATEPALTEYLAGEQPTRALETVKHHLKPTRQ